jgi:hypothetical protein
LPAIDEAGHVAGDFAVVLSGWMRDDR